MDGCKMVSVKCNPHAKNWDLEGKKDNTEVSERNL